MKKILSILAAAVITLSASAQEVGFYGNKFKDNWYIGGNAGVGTGTTNHALLKNLNLNAGFRFGKLFSPVFGLGIEGNLYFSNKHGGESLGELGKSVNYDPSFISNSYLGFVATINMNNAIGGYFGEPRKFEVILAPGFGWGHNFGKNAPGTVLNSFVNKLAVDLCYNFGDDKQYQLYVEPSLNYLIAGIDDPERDDENVINNIVHYDINNSYLQLNVGFIYKFMTSNGTHNFALVESCDNDEIEKLNKAINDLRAQNEADAAKIITLQKGNEVIQDSINACKTEEVPVVEEIKTPDLPTVFYAVNSSKISPAQEANVAVAAEVLKNHPEYNLIVKGYASPEGSHSGNNVLGENRANAVKTMLVNKFKISADRIKAQGCGETDELFPIFEFNRVAMMFLDKK